MRFMPWLLVALGLVGCGLSDSSPKPRTQPVAEPAPPSDLTPPVLGIQWVAASIAGEAARDELESWLELSKDGTITGHAGCNSFHGTYRVEGDRIFVGTIATTRMTCGDEAMDQEHRFLAAIQGAARFEVAEGRLLLYPPDSGPPTELAPLAATSHGDAVISGTVTYSGNESLPADAQLVVRLLDVTAPDAPPRVLGDTMVDPPLEPPIPFSVGYRSDAVNTDGSYVLEATVLLGDDVLLQTPRDARVLTGGHPREGVELVVAPAG